MIRFLKYLLPMMVAVVFWNCRKDIESSAVPGAVSECQEICETVCDNVISSSESELCLPRQISNASQSRVQTSARRTTGCTRTNLAFVKSGKLINAGLRYITQTNSISINSSLIEPSHRLLYLGKLII